MQDFYLCSNLSYFCIKVPYSVNTFSHHCETVHRVRVRVFHSLHPPARSSESLWVQIVLVSKAVLYRRMKTDTSELWLSWTRVRISLIRHKYRVRGNRLPTASCIKTLKISSYPNQTQLPGGQQILRYILGGNIALETIFQSMSKAKTEQHIEPSSSLAPLFDFFLWLLYHHYH